jgi:hypothetical protein
MKRLLFFMLAVAISDVTFGQSTDVRTEKTDKPGGPYLSWEKPNYDFGDVAQAIAPGERGEITIVFDSSGKFGRVNKVATVMSNAANKDAVQVLLSGNIHEKKLSSNNR